MNNRKLMKRRAPFTPRRGEVVIAGSTSRDPWVVTTHGKRRFWPVANSRWLARESRCGWYILAAVALALVSLTASGCYDEVSRAVLQCADENVRCTHVIDELCRSGDERYCDYQPWSNRGEAIAACRQAYEDCYATATTTRTPDRYEWIDGGARWIDGGAR